MLKLTNAGRVVRKDFWENEEKRIVGKKAVKRNGKTTKQTDTDVKGE